MTPEVDPRYEVVKAARAFVASTNWFRQRKESREQFERLAHALLDLGAAEQLAWMHTMEEVEQEVFPDSRPRSEVVSPIYPLATTWCEKCGHYVTVQVTPHEA